MLRRLKKPLLVLATLLVLGVGTLVVLAWAYETEVKVKLIGALNERLLAPVTVSDMDLTLIARFPMASVRLLDVKVDEVRTDGAAPDTLFYARKLFLEFDLWDLFRGSYTLQRIHGTGVRAYPGLDGNGVENFLIWKTDSAATASSPLALERVGFDDLTVRYRDDRTQQMVLAHSDALKLGGRFEATQNQLKVEGDIHLLDWQQKGVSILKDREAQVLLSLAFGGPDGEFRITKGELRTGDMPLQLTLVMTDADHGNSIDLRANGLGLDLSDVVDLLPENVHQRMKRYGMQGMVDLAVRYNGPMDGAGPVLSIGAKVEKGRMKEKRSGVAFTDIYGELALEVSANGNARKVLVKDLRARTGNGSLRGDWSSSGVKNAPLKADVQADLSLADLMRFAGVDTLEQVSGRLTLDAKVDGRLRDLADLKVTDLRALKMGGTATLRNATLKMKGVRHRVSHLDADMALSGNDARVNGLKAEVQGSPIQLSGTLHNLMPYLLFADQKLVIEAEGQSSLLDLGALLASEDGPTSATSEYALVLPKTIEMDLKIRVDELHFEEFIATDIRGTVRLKDRMLTASPVAFHTASGEVLGALSLDGRAGASATAYPLAIDATIKDIDIAQLFREFQDFGQDFLGHRHLSGRTQARIDFHAPLTPAMKLDRDRMVCVLDIAVENGAVKGLAQLGQVADHIEGNKLIAPFVDTKELRKKLADVRFERLENRIEIRNAAVHIPMMEVRSTAMDIEVSGTHYFDDRIDHHLNFRLSDLLRRNTRAEEFGPVADDGTGIRIFLHMFGTADAPEFANDGAMAAARRKDQFRKEKEELRSILKEDIFGKRKGGASPVKDEPAKPGIKIEFEGDSSRTAGAQAKHRKGLGRLLRDDADKAPPDRIKVEN